MDRERIAAWYLDPRTIAIDDYLLELEVAARQSARLLGWDGPLRRNIVNADERVILEWWSVE